MVCPERAGLEGKVIGGRKYPDPALILPGQTLPIMKRRYTLALLSLGAITAVSAQTLTDGSTSMIPGQSFTSHRAPYLAPGPAGPNQTWDFSGVPSDSVVTISYVVAGSTPEYASFPSSTAALDAGGGAYTYFKSNSSGIELMGVVGGGAVAPYQNSERIMQYPCNFNSQWVDAFSANWIANGFPVERTGTVSGFADAYGTLIMPYGNVDNVLRVRTTEIYSDSTILNIDYDFDTYWYYKPGVHNAVVAIFDQTVTIFGTPSTTQNMYWLDASDVGIDEALRNSIGVEVYPNPANTEVSVVFGADGSKGLTLEVVDLTGKVIVQQDLGSRAPGIQKETFDVSALAAGLYSVRITDGLGGQGIKRLVVE